MNKLGLFSSVQIHNEFNDSIKLVSGRVDITQENCIFVQNVKSTAVPFINRV